MMRHSEPSGGTGESFLFISLKGRKWRVTALNYPDRTGESFHLIRLNGLGWCATALDLVLKYRRVISLDKYE